jgi:hypothetical protein
MKRSQETSGDKPERPKRAKTSQACASCRKHKTRCEVSSDPKSSRCHRCNVLNMACSFEGQDMMFSGNITGKSFPAAPPSHVAASSTPSSEHSFARLPIRTEITTPDIGKLNTMSRNAKSSKPISTDDLIFCTPDPGDDCDNDWTSHPMTAMNELVRRRPGGQTPPRDAHILRDLLTDSQIQYLLKMWVQYSLPSPYSRVVRFIDPLTRD